MTYAACLCPSLGKGVPSGEVTKTAGFGKSEAGSSLSHRAGSCVNVSGTAGRIDTPETQGVSRPFSTSMRSQA